MRTRTQIGTLLLSTAKNY